MGTEINAERGADVRKIARELGREMVLSLFFFFGVCYALISFPTFSEHGTG